MLFTQNYHNIINLLTHSQEICSAVFSSLRHQTVACQAPLSVDSPGKNTGVGCHSLFEGIFLTQGSNLGLPHCRQILYHLSHQGTAIENQIFFKSHMRSYFLILIFHEKGDIREGLVPARFMFLHKRMPESIISQQSFMAANQKHSKDPSFPLFLCALNKQEI